MPIFHSRGILTMGIFEMSVDIQSDIDTGSIQNAIPASLSEKNFRELSRACNFGGTLEMVLEIVPRDMQHYPTGPVVESTATVHFDEDVKRLPEPEQ